VRLVTGLVGRGMWEAVFFCLSDEAGHMMMARRSGFPLSLKSEEEELAIGAHRDGRVIRFALRLGRCSADITLRVLTIHYP
jgi:hypothetical protein